MAGSGTGPVKGRQMGWLRHVLTVLSVLICVSSQKKGKYKHKVKWVAYVFSILLIWWFRVYDKNNDALEAKVCNPIHIKSFWISKVNNAIFTKASCFPLVNFVIA